MKIAALLVGLLGSLFVVGGGGYWAGQWQELQRSPLVKLSSDLREQGTPNAEMEEAIAGARRLGNAGYAAFGLGALAFLASLLVFKLPRISGTVMAAAVLVPAVMAPRSLVFSFILAIAAVLAFLVRSGPSAAPARA